MGIFNPGTGTGSHPRARAQRLEMLAGILAFFTLMALIQAIVLEVRGESAWLAVGVLLLFAVPLWIVVRKRLAIRL